MYRYITAERSKKDNLIHRVPQRLRMQNTINYLLPTQLMVVFL